MHAADLILALDLLPATRRILLHRLEQGGGYELTLLELMDLMKSSLNMDTDWPTFTIKADSERDVRIMGDLVER